MSLASEASPVVVPLRLTLQRQPGPLLPQIEAALARHGQPLRWAITAVELAAAGSVGAAPVPAAVLQIEAVVLA